MGCGYVGLTTAAILSNCGFEVRALEVHPDRLQTIQRGRSFFYEAGIDQLLRNAFDNKMLRVTDTYEELIPGSDVVFSCVGTPDNPDGSSNLSYVFEAATKAARLLEPGAIFVQKSTVPVGTGERLEALFKEMGKPTPYVSNPEFLREGTAISDTIWFDRIVAGSDDTVSAQTILDIYNVIEQSRDTISEIAEIDRPDSIPDAQYILTSRNSAELIKVTANAFLALKISFSNSIAKLADKANANVVQVMDAVGADRRIGRSFLNAGRGYGGGCFPKDVSGLIRSAEDYGVAMEIMQAAGEVNASMPHYIINKAKAAFHLGPGNGVFMGKEVTVLGLAFKSGTSDVRRSPALAIANTLAEQGAVVRAYDPEAMEEAREHLDPAIVLTSSLDEAIEGSECIFVATDWPVFASLHWQKLSAKLVVDCMNYLDAKAIRAAKKQYVGVGI